MTSQTPDMQAVLERLDKLERQNRWLKRAGVPLLALVNLLVVGVGLYYFGFRFASGTLVVHKVMLTAPDGRVRGVLAVDNKWDEGIQTKDYYAGLEFRDEKGERKMSLFGTGIFLWQGDERTSLAFNGLDISNKKEKTQIMLNSRLFSYASGEGERQLVLYPHPQGINLTIHTGENECGIMTRRDQASMYVAGQGAELDVTADRTGTGIQRYSKRAASR